MYDLKIPFNNQNINICDKKSIFLVQRMGRGISLVEVGQISQLLPLSFLRRYTGIPEVAKKNKGH